MRVTGIFLLIGGLILCISIVWAAPGFLMMGLGLICLQVRRRKRSPRPTASSVDNVVARREPSLFPEEAAPRGGQATSSADIETRPETSPLDDKRPSPRVSRASRLNQIDARKERIRGLENTRPLAAIAVRSDTADRQERPARSRKPEQPELAAVVPEQQSEGRQRAVDAHSHDAERWSLLVASDADIARAAAALAPFGQKYVDELAKACLAIDAREYLPIIFRKIAANVKRDTGKSPAGAVAAERVQDADVISLAFGKAQNVKMERVFDEPAGRVSPADDPGPSDDAPNLEPDAQQKHATVQPAASRARSEHGRTADEGTDATRAAEVAAVLPAGRQAAAAGPADDLEDLTDLFNRFGLVDARAGTGR
jgi:hypothetical protein